MDWDKFENNLKEKMEDRKLSPSNDSWEKLSAQLGGEEEKKATNLYWWWGIAASFLAGILVATFMFKKQDAIEIVQPKVAVQKKVEPSYDNQDNSVEKNLKQTHTNSEAVTVVEEKTEVKIEEKKSHPIKPKKEATSSIAQQESPLKDYEKNNVAENSKINNGTDTEQNQDKLVDETSSKILQDIQELNKNEAITDAEIEKLIREAQFKIKTKSILSENSNKVNAQALLEDVESELEQSFRQRVFEAIQEGLYQMKTAVANRGY